MQMRERANIFFCRTDHRVEGYVESVAIGWLAGQNAARLVSGRDLISAPRLSAMARWRAMFQTRKRKISNR